MAVITPTQFNRSSNFLPERNIVTPEIFEVNVSGLQPEEDDILQLTPNYGAATNFKATIWKLDVFIPDGVGQAAADKLVIFSKKLDKPAEGTKLLELDALAAPSGASTLNNQEQETDSTSGLTGTNLQLQFRSLEFPYVGIQYSADKSAAIAASKVVYVKYGIVRTV